MDILWPGIAVMAAMYLLVLLVGVLASTRARSRADGDSLGELMLAGRALPLGVGLLTMTATWVGGGYINGTAERAYSLGPLWGAQAGLGYALSLVLGGLFFARIMRRHAFTTLVDPLEARYGKRTAAVLMVPAVLGELFWSAAILVALGSTFGTVIGLADLRTAIVLSAAVAVGYTLAGGLRAVAYTDVVQLAFMLLGLGLAILFFTDTGNAGTTTSAAIPLGFASQQEGFSWVEWTIILMLGGIPWNVYFQRVLASPGEEQAARLSLGAGLLCALLAVPPLILGLWARGLDWAVLGASEAGMALGGPDAIASTLEANPAFVLPYVLRLAVPTWVAILGLGAISAAVMSSVDSSILSASSLIAWNGYRRLLRPDADDASMKRMVRVLVAVLGVAATALALTTQSVAALWYLCGDVVYCVLFPQLTLALFDPKANRSGALAGLAISVVLRLGGGEATLGLPAFLPYPAWVDGEFPFRTLAMVCGLLTAWTVARLTTSVDPPRALHNPSRSCP